MAIREVSAESMQIRSSDDIVLVRQAVRRKSVALGFGLVDQTKVVTASSELARNTLDYGGGGVAHLELVENGTRSGLRITFEDQGPGIADLDLALTDGYTTGNGMGLGLSGAKRLSHEFELWSKPGEGPRGSFLRGKCLATAVRIVVEKNSITAEGRRTAREMALELGMEEGGAENVAIATTE